MPESDPACYLTTPHLSAAPRRRRPGVLAALVLLALGSAALFWELRESWLQSWFFSRYAQTATWQMRPGTAVRIWLPSTGPYPERLGYTRLADFIPRLQMAGFAVVAQAEQSSRFREIVEQGFNPIYPEKAQAGLVLFDRQGQTLYSRRYPQRQYTGFEQIPELVAGTLLFIENRDLLGDAGPRRNPAVDWGRLARVAAGQGLRLMHLGGDRAGGSTLATQIEKFRYSPGGRTRTADDKLRQMISASLRAYRSGKDTLPARRQIVLDYLNSVPLGGVAGHGEVNGLGDGLWAWFGADFSAVNRALADPQTALPERARALRQVLSLLVAQRRPSDLLAAGESGLARLVDSHLRLLVAEGLLDPELGQAAQAVLLSPRRQAQSVSDISFVERKAANDLRLRLGELLGIRDLYALDRFDIEVHSTFDATVQRDVTDFLSRLNDPAQVNCLGMNAFRMLDRGNPGAVNYSLTLYEATPDGNAVRVQADNLDQPLDINAGTKLDLGSSAKLRTLVSYLNVIADLHRRLSAYDDAALVAHPVHPSDRLSRWAVDYLREHPGGDLGAMLAAALERRYSADPTERFFTGGGIHTFANFKREDDATVPSVQEALEQSVNLSFVRIMQDVVHYHAYEAEGAPARRLQDGDDDVRQEFLRRFAEHEGLGFLRTFWHKYRDVAPADRLDVLAEAVPARRSAQAAAFRSVRPQAGFEAFSAFLNARLGEVAGTEAMQRTLYDRYAADRLSLSDQAYLARVHPLELWLLRYLDAHPDASLRDAVPASVEARHEAARWLMSPRFRQAQDLRIRIVVEVAAFERIAEEWKRLGYPFEQLVPSLATSIGSSADRPAALAELMGVLLADGIRQATVSIDEIRLAPGTPYETVLRRRPENGTAQLPDAVARTARAALLRVVEHGTARRVAGTYRDSDGQPVAVGGKTGTGDHRSKVIGRDGGVVSAKVMNRAATFAFYIGDRHFGVVTAFVPGRQAGAYHFTSALPVQILKELEPALRPLVNGQPAAALRCAPAPG